MGQEAAGLAARFALLLGELVALFLAVAFAVAVAARGLGVGRLRRPPGGNRVAGPSREWCSASSHPSAPTRRSPCWSGCAAAARGPPPGSGFLLAAPVLDPLIGVAIAVVFSPQAAVAYTVTTFLGVTTVAVLADVLRIERFAVSVRGRAAECPAGAPAIRAGQRGDGGGDDPFTDASPWRGGRAEVARAGRAAFDLVRGNIVALAVAVAFAALITGFVPDRLLVGVAGPSNPFAVPLAALLGTPFYVSGEAFLPVAAALLSRGMDTGPCTR